MAVFFTLHQGVTSCVCFLVTVMLLSYVCRDLKVLEAEGAKRTLELKSEGRKIQLANESEGYLIQVKNEALATRERLILEVMIQIKRENVYMVTEMTLLGRRRSSRHPRESLSSECGDSAGGGGAGEGC